MSFSSPPDYVQLPFTTDPTSLADEATAFLQAAWPNWQPNDADMEVVLIEALAPMAVNAAQIASNMPPAALIAFGTKLLGIPYNAGVSASATATFTVQDTAGYDIPAGSEVDIGGVAFQTIADLVIAPGATTGSVQVAANDVGAFANGLSATGWSAVNLPVYVTGMTLSANTSGGVDQQDDNAYLNTVAQALQLRARSVITLLDFEIVAVNVAGIARCVAVANSTHPRNITVFVTDSSGNPVASAIKTTLATQLAATRMVNAVITVTDPTYTTVSVTYEALAMPGTNAAGLLASINSRLALELSPAGWGTPNSGQSPGPGLTWVDQPVVHLNRLIGVISSVSGVNYVVSCSISASNVAQVRAGALSSALSTGGGAITALPVVALPNAVASGATVTVTDPTGANTQTWTTTSAAAVGATTIAVTSQTPNFNYPIGSTVAYGMSTAVAATSLGVVALPNALASGTVVTLTDPTGTHTQTWTLTSAAAIAATSLAVTSQTPNFAYPPGSIFSGAVTGDLTMSGPSVMTVATLPSGALSAALSTGAAITSLPVLALPNNTASGATVTVTDPTGAHTQTWTTTAAVAAGATSIPVTSQTPNFAYPIASTVSAPENATIAATQWGVNALVNAIPSGTILTLIDPTGVHTQSWVTSAVAAIGATSIAVTSQTPNFAYPPGSTFSEPVTAPGSGLLPKPGTFTGLIDLPAT